MGDYYNFLSSMTGVGDDVGVHPLHPASSLPLGPVPVGTTSLHSPYANVAYFSDFSDQMGYGQPKAPPKSRRKAGAPSVEHVKHRRTRSGCFTCRGRRVKCDEARPVCERCRKGNRDCVYPETSGSKGSSSRSTAAKNPIPEAPSSPSSNDEQEEPGREVKMEPEREVKLEPIMDEDEESADQEPIQYSSSIRRGSTTSGSNINRGILRIGSETPSQEGNKSSSPSASTTSSSLATTLAYTGPDPRPEWAHLSPEFRNYLDTFYDQMNHYHYCISSDVDDFFRVILPTMAARDEGLLHAVVGFTAYHVTLADPNGKIQEFLHYYNRSVQLLIGVFQKKEKPTATTLLTILQLATIEEYLGDWVNLMGHQKAAIQILTSLYTPQTVMHDPVGRMSLLWYIRFDVFVALMGGFRTALPREWFSTMATYCQAQATANPENLRWKYALVSAQLRLITMEMSLLFASGNKGEVTPEGFAIEHDRLMKELEGWRAGMDPALTDQQYLVMDMGDGLPDPDDIVNPYQPGVLFDYPIFTTNLMISEWHSCMIMHLCQSSTLGKQALFAELGKHSYAICQIFESVEYWPHTPRGSLVLIQACIAISALFLPQDARHHRWIRRKFALLESMGYIQAISLRAKMAEIFQDPGCVRWWLPNDEGYSKILHSVRAFADERNAKAMTTQAEDLREVRHIFSKLELADEPDEGTGKGKGP